MNLKTGVLKIAVVIALICMLVPVIAAEDVDNSAVAESVDDSDVISEDIDATDDGTDEYLDETDDETYDETDEEDEVYDEEGTDDETYDDESADLQVVVVNSPQKADVGDLVKFGIVVANNGPDTAHNVVVSCKLLSGSMKVTDWKLSHGTFDPTTGLWYVGDLDSGEVAAMYLEGIVLTPEDLLLSATVVSDTYDPDLSNNVAFGFVDVAGDAQSSEEASETLPETGNPVALAILALLSIAGVSLRKKF